MDKSFKFQGEISVRSDIAIGRLYIKLLDNKFFLFDIDIKAKDEENGINTVTPVAYLPEGLRPRFGFSFPLPCYLSKKTVRERNIIGLCGYTKIYPDGSFLFDTYDGGMTYQRIFGSMVVREALMDI